MSHVKEQHLTNYSFKQNGKILLLGLLGLDFQDLLAAATTNVTKCGEKEKEHRLELEMSLKKVGLTAKIANILNAVCYYYH